MLGFKLIKAESSVQKTSTNWLLNKKSKLLACIYKNLRRGVNCDYQGAFPYKTTNILKILLWCQRQAEAKDYTW